MNVEKAGFPPSPRQKSKMIVKLKKEMAKNSRRAREALHCCVILLIRYSLYDSKKSWNRATKCFKNNPPLGPAKCDERKI